VPIAASTRDSSDDLAGTREGNAAHKRIDSLPVSNASPVPLAIPYILAGCPMSRGFRDMGLFQVGDGG